MFTAAAHYISKTTMFLGTFILIIFFSRFFLVDIGRVNGQSMEPGFRDSNIFFVNKILYMFRAPRRFEIVQLFESNKSDALLIKRVIGLPGETIVVRQNSVFIRDAQGNDQKIDEPYLSSDVITRMPVGRDIAMHVPENSYLVFGDNRLFSTDSRYYGPIHRRLIVGKLFSF